MAARVRLGRGGALKAVLFYLFVRAVLSLLVGPVLGRLAIWPGDTAGVHGPMEEAVSILRSHGDPAMLAYALSWTLWAPMGAGAGGPVVIVLFFVGALGPAAFHTAMLTGRLVGAAVAGRLGPAGTLGVAGIATATGMAVALVVAAPALAIPGMALAALGGSFVLPMILSLAGGRAGAHAGRAASYVFSLGYVGFLVAPTLVGGLSELGGLRLGLLVIPVAGATIALASRTRLARR